MAARVAIALLWVIAIGLLVTAMQLSKVTDIYIHDFYFIVPRLFVIGLILVALVIPLLAVSIRRFRSTH